MNTARGDLADQPTELSGRSWVATLKRTVREFRDDNLMDWAASLTYYSILSLFPALIVMVSVLGLIGESATEPLLDNIATATPGPAQEIVTNAINDITASQGAAGVLFVVGLAVALWSASTYIGAFIRASNAIYEVEEGRPFWRLRPLQIAVTVTMILLLAVSATAVVLTGGLAEEAGSLIGVGDTAVSIWDVAKWPVLLLLVSLMFAILYWAAPNVRQPGFRWITPGGITAVVLWIVASAAFAFYVANFGSYNKTYGSLGGVVVFLVWLWISNMAVLLGAELDAELERSRELEAGVAAEDQIRLPPRVPAKEDDR